MLTSPTRRDTPEPLPMEMVVDDIESVRTFVERVLRDGGYEAATVTHGASAPGQDFLRWLLEEHPGGLTRVELGDVISRQSPAL